MALRGAGALGARLDEVEDQERRRARARRAPARRTSATPTAAARRGRPRRRMSRPRRSPMTASQRGIRASVSDATRNFASGTFRRARRIIAGEMSKPTTLYRASTRWRASVPLPQPTSTTRPDSSAGRLPTPAVGGRIAMTPQNPNHLGRRAIGERSEAGVVDIREVGGIQRRRIIDPMVHRPGLAFPLADSRRRRVRALRLRQEGGTVGCRRDRPGLYGLPILHGKHRLAGWRRRGAGLS